MPNFEGAMESIFYLVEYMNRQDEPFDGFAGFSQGIYTVMMMYKVQ
jgi:malonyl CoA-acyl carrier protein transacylase